MARRYTTDKELRCGDIFVIKKRSITCGIPSVQKRIGFSPAEAAAVHVGLILDKDGNIAESLGRKGVCFGHISKYKNDSYIVLRPRYGSIEDIQVCLEAANYMLRAARIHYDWLAILGLWLFSFIRCRWLLGFLNKRYKLICTEWVLKIYELAHKPIDSSAMRYYPANFIRLFNRGILTLVDSNSGM